MTTSAKAPPHLQAAGRRLFSRVCRDFDVSGGELELLSLACSALDRAEQAREAIEAHGLLVDGRFGIRQSPAVAIENSSVLRCAALLRQLNLPAEVAQMSQPAQRPRAI